ncbi:NACHT, LRR and PYD domains-containing protein 1 homolog [Engraulis encrasicolus]|uniref:NACHT, LRR and PYD domains-containing protein 1 homolog n=1 Tax=Engraulis encrasicolus TaxID=184585 RepID=UPI002FD36C75
MASNQGNAFRDDDDHSGDTQGCECCAEVPDTSHWVLVEPEVSTEKSVSTYSLSSTAGSYECSLSGLRWLSHGPIKLQYHFMDWHVFAKELDNMQCSPAGPLMDIKLTSGELEDIHLPHFLCLGAGEASMCDTVRVLHGHDCGVCVEGCELTRHHARIVQPSLSPLGVLWKAVEYLFPPKAHFEPLLFYTRTDPLELHLYLVPKPWDPAHIKAIQQEETPQGVRIRKPGPSGKSLRLDASVCVTTSCLSEIQPNRRDLSELLSPSTSDYFEVYIRHPGDSFDMEVISSAENGEPIWKRKIRREDYRPDEPPQRIRIPGQVDPLLAAASLEEKRPQLIQRVTEVMPIADQLLSQGFIGQETYANIQAAATSQDKMRLLFEGLRSAGAQGKLALYTILQTLQPHLVEELWTTR